MTSRRPPQCLSCNRWNSPLNRVDADAKTDAPTQVCEAYPLTAGGIPENIWWNQVDHREPQPGDHNLQWIPAPGVTYPDWALATEGA